MKKIPEGASANIETNVSHAGINHANVQKDEDRTTCTDS